MGNQRLRGGEGLKAFLCFWWHRQEWLHWKAFLGSCSQQGPQYLVSENNVPLVCPTNGVCILLLQSISCAMLPWICMFAGLPVFIMEFVWPRYKKMWSTTLHLILYSSKVLGTCFHFREMDPTHSKRQKQANKQTLSIYNLHTIPI